MINDPYLTFPVIDCNEELDIYSESNTSGIANSWANGDEDDNLSDLLSASQIGTIGTMLGESELQLFSEASCAHSVRLSTATSHLSDYFSEEDGNKSLESLIFTCEEHSLQYTDVNEFEDHQVNFHTVNGRFLCGLLTGIMPVNILGKVTYRVHIWEQNSCVVSRTVGKSFPRKNTVMRTKKVITEHWTPTCVIFVITVILCLIKWKGYKSISLCTVQLKSIYVNIVKSTATQDLLIVKVTKTIAT